MATSAFYRLVVSSPNALCRDTSGVVAYDVVGEPVISGSPMPPPCVNEAKTRPPAESSVVVATLML